MALQICPKCNIESFTWTYDDEDTPPTSWGCGNCGYYAREDESYERVCDICGTESKMRLEDDEQIFWWCCSCNNTEMISKK